MLQITRKQNTHIPQTSRRGKRQKAKGKAISRVNDENKEYVENKLKF